MSKFKFNQKTNDLFQAILSLDNLSQSRAFFRDLCTVEEIKDMADRWQIVLRLEKGESYRSIARDLGVSTTTVARVASWLNNGQGGYKSVLEKISHHHKPSSAGKGV